MTIRIYYFSGTGNTLAVVQHLTQALQHKGAHVEIRSIETAMQDHHDLADCDMIGIAYPIYGFGTPRLLYRFMKYLPKVQRRKVFLLKTGADIIRVNHASSSTVIRKLRKKGYNVFYDRIVAMGSNWLVGYDDGLVKQLHDASREKMVHMADDLMAERIRLYDPGILLRGLARVVAALEQGVGARCFGKSLYASKACSGCMLCMCMCPTGNITYTGDRMHFHSRCLSCMRCIYACPTRAIRSRGMNFTILKAGYDLRKVLQLNPQPYVTEATRGYYRHFWAYLRDARK